MICNHKNAFTFHDNAPMHCPDCDNYLTPQFLEEDRILKERKNKIDKILTNI